ncbi:MAG TPA: TonB family protein [Thermoanaerobaculia bacterium]|nr:TonB family protein [Thermoanaerobaculia bacterium]
MHRVLHDTLALSWPFLVAVVLIAVLLTAMGLLLSHRKRLSASSRHLILSLALLVPAIAAVVAATGLAEYLRPDAAIETTAAVTTIDFTLTPGAPARPSELACIVFGVWLAGTAAFGTLSLLPWLRFARIARRAAVRSGSVRTSVEVTEPMVIGFLKPSIVLPDRYAEALAKEELDAVFAHEREHIRRRDNLTAAFHEVVSALFWFDPLHWKARRRVLELRERACDERVLARGCGVNSYVSALAKSCHAAIESPAVACMSGFHVRERIESIMSYPSDRLRFLSETIVRGSALAAAFAMVLSFALLAPPPSVAATGQNQYSFDVQLRPGPEGRVLVEVTVIAPDGERVMSGKATTNAGQPVRLSTARGDRVYQVDVTPGGTASLEVTDRGAVIHRAARNVAAPAAVGEREKFSGQPISLNLKDAGLHNVMNTFSQLTGTSIVVDPGIDGTVTLHVTGMPWDEALLRSIEPLGLAAVTDNGVIRIIRPGDSPYKRLGKNMKGPQILTRVDPQYTTDARKARIAGVVILELAIDETGIVRETRIFKDLPHGLGNAAADAVRQWTFAPALLDGQPVAVKYNVTVNFKLDEDAERAAVKQ